MLYKGVYLINGKPISLCCIYHMSIWGLSFLKKCINTLDKFGFHLLKNLALTNYNEQNCTQTALARHGKSISLTNPRRKTLNCSLNCHILVTFAIRMFHFSCENNGVIEEWLPFYWINSTGWHFTLQLLDEAIRDLQSQVNKQLCEHQLKPPPPDACKVELVSTSRSVFSQFTNTKTTY